MNTDLITSGSITFFREKKLDDPFEQVFIHVIEYHIDLEVVFACPKFCNKRVPFFVFCDIRPFKDFQILQ